MITAVEARNMTCDLEKLTRLERLREIWICGKINKSITKAARKGKFHVSINFTAKFNKRILQRICNYYKNAGYNILIKQFDSYGCTTRTEDNIVYRCLIIAWEERRD